SVVISCTMISTTMAPRAPDARCESHGAGRARAAIDVDAPAVLPLPSVTPGRTGPALFACGSEGLASGFAWDLASAAVDADPAAALSPRRGRNGSAVGPPSRARACASARHILPQCAATSR